MSSGRILVIRGGAIGDFILTLPVFQAIRNNFPIATVEVLGYSHITALAKISGLVDEQKGIESQGVAGFFARNGDLNEEWQAYFSRFEIIISYLFDPDKIFETNIGRCSKAHYIAGPHRPKESDDVHAVDVFLKPLEQLAVFEVDDSPRLTIAAPDTVPEGHTLMLHPGSGSPSKNWPLDRWGKLINHLLENTDWNLLVVGGEAERLSLESVKQSISHPRLKWEICRPLAELAPLLAQCKGFVGHDSGISHLAAALNLPGLVLWGPSKAKIWRPRSENVVVIKHEHGLDNLPVDQIIARIPEPHGPFEANE
jgi:heptosyltransferase III